MSFCAQILTNFYCFSIASFKQNYRVVAFYQVNTDVVLFVSVVIVFILLPPINKKYSCFRHKNI